MLINCRLCRGTKFEPVLDLGNLYMSDFVPQGTQLTQASLNLIQCSDCGLAQLDNTASLEKMYQEKYWYKSGINPVIVNDLKEIAEIAKNYLRPGEILLDIGANDGTLTKQFGPEYITVGCEPAKNFHAELSQNCNFMMPTFWSKGPYILKKAKVITAIGMFYDTDDPNQFVSDMEAVLDDNGVVIAQLMTLKPMLLKNDVGNICHEHLEYYSYKNLVKLFEDNGLEVFEVQENDINGGSYRLFARKYRVGSVNHEEGELDLAGFAARVERNKNETVAFIKKLKEKDKHIYGYGASTKGNTILQYYDLDFMDIDGIADKNPEKLGLFTPGTHIPVVDEEEARAKADYFFILPWGFTDSFIKKEREAGYKGGFVVSTPEFKVYDPIV